MEGHLNVGVRHKLIIRQETLQQRHHHLLVPVLHAGQVKVGPADSHGLVPWSVHVSQFSYSPVEQELCQSGASYLRNIPLRRHSGKEVKDQMEVRVRRKSFEAASIRMRIDLIHCWFYMCVIHWKAE